MNREIKFRAWDKVKKEFIDFNKIGFLEDGSMWYLQGLDEYENEIDPPYFEDDDTWVLLQFTGLKDKNGVEIYEGDYLSVIIFEDNQEYKGSVVFAEGGFCLEIAMLDNKYKIPFVSFGKDVISEVIGSIYENPELLEESK